MTPKSITRDEAIEKLIEERLSNWDSDDIDEALRTGRYGYAELPNAELAQTWSDFFNESVTITGDEPEPTIEVKQAEHDAMTQFIALIAGMKTEEEFGEEGMSGDDAVMTLSELIATARTLGKE